MRRFSDDPWLTPRGTKVPSLSGARWADWDPKVGWEARDKEYVVRAEVPGFEPTDFDVKVTGNTVTVHAEHKDEKRGGHESYGYCFGSFSRAFTLPHGVEESKINARYHSGVLELHLPKTEQAQGKRIPVITN
jgi:HSP20 family protein